MNDSTACNNPQAFLKGQSEITLEIFNKQFCKMSKEAQFCCACFPKAPAGTISLLEGNNETTWILPRNTPQTLLALRKATGSFTTKESVLGMKKQSLLIPQRHAVTVLNKLLVFLNHSFLLSSRLCLQLPPKHCHLDVS